MMTFETFWNLKSWTCVNCGASCACFQSGVDQSLTIAEDETRLFRADCQECDSIAEILMNDGCIITYRTFDGGEGIYWERSIREDRDNIGSFKWGPLLGSQWDHINGERIQNPYTDNDEIPF